MTQPQNNYNYYYIFYYNDLYSCYFCCYNYYLKLQQLLLLLQNWVAHPLQRMHPYKCQRKKATKCLAIARSNTKLSWKQKRMHWQTLSHLHGHEGGGVNPYFAVIVSLSLSLFLFLELCYQSYGKLWVRCHHDAWCCSASSCLYKPPSYTDRTLIPTYFTSFIRDRT